VESNSCIEAEWLLASHLLGVSLPMAPGIVKTLLQRQRPDGAWDIFPNAPDGDINSTVEVYAGITCDGARPWRGHHAGITSRIERDNPVGWGYFRTSSSLRSQF
jgi:hypothetical protein